MIVFMKEMIIKLPSKDVTERNKKGWSKIIKWLESTLFYTQYKRSGFLYMVITDLHDVLVQEFSQLKFCNFRVIDGVWLQNT